MKKTICLLLIGLVLLSGCGSKTEEKKNEAVNDTNVTTETTTVATNNEITTTKKEEKTTKKTEKSTKKPTTTAKKEENKPSGQTTTTAAKTLGKNMYISVKDGKVHKYTYTYKDKTACNKNGDEHFDVVNPTHPYVAFGCDEVNDSNGNTLWGVFFYKEADDASIFYC